MSRPSSGCHGAILGNPNRLRMHSLGQQTNKHKGRKNNKQRYVSRRCIEKRRSMVYIIRYTASGGQATKMKSRFTASRLGAKGASQALQRLLNTHLCTRTGISKNQGPEYGAKIVLVGLLPQGHPKKDPQFIETAVLELCKQPGL